jgi:ATP-dependent RNA helicase DDX27
MAPSAISNDLNDDFILTLSDDEDEAAHIEGGELESALTETRKRKRDQKEHDKNTKNKKQKNDRKGVKSVDRAGTRTEEAEDERWVDHGEDDGALASDFEFQVGETTGIIEDFDGWEVNNDAKQSSNSGSKKGVDIDEIIARRKDTGNGNNHGTMGDEQSDEDFNGFDDEDEFLASDGFGMGAEDGLEEEDEQDDTTSEREWNDSSDDGQQSSGNEMDSNEDSVASPVVHPDDLESPGELEEEEDDDPAETKRKAAFFAPDDNLEGLKPQSIKTGSSFQAMSLSRPILKGLSAVGFSEPTPIQAKTIPIGLLGKDVVGGAVTGSGKTAAFIIPILERLLYRPKKVPTTRVAVLMPTRELAVQCFNVAKKLASFTDITFAQIVGGFSLREQEQVLKSRPDVIIATPGRFIDHMRNSPSFAVDTLEILVLDEADRMLEDGFADELNEILTTIPKSRQTMLFSATMTDSVDKLIRLGLNRPVRLMIDAKKKTVSGLVQEFVRLRQGREDKRLAYLMYLCDNVYTDRTIIFFRQKREAHRVRIIFGLCSLKAAELHGSMSQEQRIHAVEAFRAGTVSFLLATDLASRGLDIKNVSTVINYEAPQSHEIYLHRVGRTARAGRSGRACTIAAEPDRKVVKAAVKAARVQGAKIASRIVPSEEADKWAERLNELQDDVDAVLVEEKEEKALTTAERDMKKGENLFEHEKEIMSRPKRTWFESNKDKRLAKEKGWMELNADTVEGKMKKEKRKLSNKEKKKLNLKDERKEGKIWKKGKSDRNFNGLKVKVARNGKPKGGSKKAKKRSITKP